MNNYITRDIFTRKKENIDIAHFVAAFQHANDGIVVFSRKGEILSFNPAFKEFFDLGKSEKASKEINIDELRNNYAIYALNHPDSIPYDDWPYMRVLREESFDKEQFYILNKENSKKWHALVSGKPIMDEHDNFVFGILFFKDISDLVKLKDEKEIKAREYQLEDRKLQKIQDLVKAEQLLLKSIIDTIPVMITLYDEEVNIIVNKAFEKITGWTKEDIHTSNVMELVYPDPGYREKVKKIMDKLTPGFNDIIMYTKKGFYLETSWANVKLPDGKRVGIGLDASSMKQAEKELKESEERFRNLADNISQFAWMTDKSGNITWYNKRWYDYSGTTYEEMKGLGWTKVHHPDHVDRVVTHIKDCFEKGTRWEDTFPLRNKSGKYRWFLSRALPLKNDNGEITGWFGTNTDITESKKLQEELITAKEKAEKAISVQSSFIQNISHEVRTPMNSILGFTELLQKTIKTGNEERFLNAISYNGKQLLRLIDDIVDLSRLDKNELSLSKSVVQPEKVIHQTRLQFEGLKLMLKKEHLDLIIKTVELLPNIYLYTDYHRLQQVINNLVSNAVKYTDEGYVEIGLDLDEKRKEIIFHVKDTGIGIDRVNFKRVFKRFQQFDTSDKKKFSGTGLGLAISKNLVKLFGGKIWFDSKFGVGTTFYFTHPYIESNKGVQRKNKQLDLNSKQKPILNGKTILIAEDDEYSYLMMEAMLMDTKARILHAANGKKALEIFEKHDIDLIFLDIRLPDMTGYDILKEIKKKNIQVPLIAQTAFAMPEEKRKSMKEGFDFHATKPLSQEDLYIILNKFLPGD